MTIVLLSLFIWFALGFVSAEVAGKLWKSEQFKYTYGGYVLVFSLGAVSFISIILAKLTYYIDKPIERFKK